MSAPAYSYEYIERRAQELLERILALRSEEIDRELAELGIDVPQTRERYRQLRIRAGLERACAGCGCSESRACPEGCFWATEQLCSRCV